MVRVGRSYVAKAYTGNKFLGWYADEATEAFSNEPNLTGMEDELETATNIYAKFENNNLLSDIAGAENLDSIQLYMPKDTLLPNGNYFYLNGNSNWRNAQITKDTNYVHSGSKAIQIYSPTEAKSCIVMQNLKINTPYKVSFWWKINKPNGKISKLLVGPMNVDDGKNINNTNKLGGSYDDVNKDPNSDWTYTEVEFDTRDNTSVKLFYYYDTSYRNENGQLPWDTYLYMDELTLNEVPNPAN